MGFAPGVHYPHPPRGKARHPYRVTAPALTARRRNLRLAKSKGRANRLRSERESRIIKLLIWLSCFPELAGGSPSPSQRALARQLGVWPSYVCKVARQAHAAGWEALVAEGRPVTRDHLAEARRSIANLREIEPGLLAPPRRPYRADGRAGMSHAQLAMPGSLSRTTAEENTGQARREDEEWKRGHLPWACTVAPGGGATDDAGALSSRHIRLAHTDSLKTQRATVLPNENYERQ